ncbi:MAG: hypothetical protein R3Y47_05265 [Lachnospiraceae bacterium]
MNILEAQRALVKLAKQKGVPTSEVEREISEAVMYASNHGDEITRKHFKDMFGDEHVPTPAQMLMNLVNTHKNMR